MALSEKALEAIKSDSDLRAKLMLVPDRLNGKGRSEYTIKRWIMDNDDQLTKAKYLAVIKEHTGFTEEEILEVETVKA